MFKTPDYRILFFIYLLPVMVFLFIADILPQSKDKTTNWPEPVFEHITVQDGLPENSVRCIMQDHLGYLWFGTQNGLVRYDGYNMKVYQNDPNDSLSISDGSIGSIYDDKSGTLWVGTRLAGLVRFNRAAGTFTRFMHNPEDSTSIPDNHIKCITEDKYGNIMIGTDEGFSILNKKTKNLNQSIMKHQLSLLHSTNS